MVDPGIDALGFNQLPMRECNPKWRGARPCPGAPATPPARMDAGLATFFELFSIFFKKTLKFRKTLPLPIT
jgi:hypothetical protein